MEPLDEPHRRHDPLTGRWVLVSPQRTERPWQGQEEAVAAPTRPVHDPSCYLCPGNERVGGERNPDYEGTWWFTNDFAALLPDATPPDTPPAGPGLLRAEAVSGTCRVLCFSPRHDLALARADLGQLRQVVDLWDDQYRELADRWAYVQVFENRGPAMGASNPHPHGQLWATSSLPRRVATEDDHQARHHDAHGGVLLLDTLAEELAAAERVLVTTTHWVAVVPWWATWPYEVLLVPRAHRQRLTDLGEAERDDLCLALSELLARFDNLFRAPFPYSMGWHVAPGADADRPHWQLHAHFYPPLLRSSTVRKFMVGFELLAEEQRDITPEAAAANLLAVPGAHHLGSPAVR